MNQGHRRRGGRSGPNIPFSGLFFFTRQQDVWHLTLVCSPVIPCEYPLECLVNCWNVEPANVEKVISGHKDYAHTHTRTLTLLFLSELVETTVHKRSKI